ncbi:oligosaccharide repeat unit polymerase [Psychrobacillus sp. AK 1817]|uniref:Oligosaccharide repeat unit polymerase n=1 Tax=Psychrobacillus faecigallinarum TaxID=2762235 RepID=A0ABR8R5L9_9BACI|nr:MULTISPECIES: oligosaccharide repeat unit polymerase [Psychrobacillus]MBD7943069.1 oligosaccharide repeat unit polymerase [Psychrobacillus faecigallinarum]QEY20524.1 oligosaccharide repeat unit polymerase [Psychrobacillus sp. AK 1817]QGM31059.1 oligosaccharide repeat unit polymerase [Bacillus sp. N3536]
MLIFSIWLFTVVASTYLFKKVSGSLSLVKPNMISIVYYYSFLISSYIGGLLIALGIDDYYMIKRMDHEEYRIIGFILLTLLMILFPLTQLVVGRILGFNAELEFNKYLQEPVRTSVDKNKRIFRLAFGALSAISVLAVAYTLLKTANVPLLELLKGNTSELAKLRIDASRGFSGIDVYIRNIFGIALTPVLSIVAFVYMTKSRALYWKVVFFTLFISSILISTYDLAKSPIFFYLIMLLLAGVYTQKLKLNWKRISGYIIAGSALLIVMYVAIQGVTELESFLAYNSGPIGRILLAQISPFFLHLDTFSHSLSPLEAKGLPSFIAGIFDIEQVRSARMVMENVFPENIDKGTGGVLNTIFLGEAFASYGYLGVIVAIIYIAAVIQVLYIIFLRLPKTPVVIALFVYFTINIPRTLVGGVADFFFNPIWIIMTVVLGGLFILEQYFHVIWKFLLSKVRKKGVTQ